MIAQRIHPFDVIVRVFAERLRGRAASEELQVLVHHRRADWERIIGHASTQFVLPALGAAMKDLALIGPQTELGAFLEAVHAANLERNNAFCNELATAVGILNWEGIEPGLLKGAIRLADGLYPDHGWRVLRDLDRRFSLVETSTGGRATLRWKCSPPSTQDRSAVEACWVAAPGSRQRAPMRL